MFFSPAEIAEMAEIFLDDMLPRGSLSALSAISVGLYISNSCYKVTTFSRQGQIFCLFQEETVRLQEIE